jgi:hypothetical protein
MGDSTDDRIDERIGQVLDTLQPRTRQRVGYKSSHIAKNYEKLERAHRELGWSYKELAELLTKEGRPTKLATLKYNMRKIAAQRQGGIQGLGRTTKVGQSEQTALPIPKDPREPEHSSTGDNSAVRRLPSETPKESAGTVKRFKR